MRTLDKNKRSFYVSSPITEQPILDKDGFETGETEIKYSEPVKQRGNISEAQGESANKEFGNITDYDKVIVLSKLSCPITETSRLWVDNTDITKPADYSVKCIARSLNSISVAIKKEKRTR